MQRMWRIKTQQRIAQEADYPPPTPRTRHSAWGMHLWEKMLEQERRSQALNPQHYKKPFERVGIEVVGAYLAFDHKVWKEYGEFVWYRPKEHRAYRRSELPRSGAQAKVKTDAAGTKKLVEYETFGR